MFLLTLTYVAVPVCGRARGCARRAGQYLQDQTIILPLALILILILTLTLTLILTLILTP